jgi:hypothetical protein
VRGLPLAKSKHSQKDAFSRRDGKKKTPENRGAPKEIYVAVDQFGNIHDSSKHEDFIEEQMDFMRKTFKINFKCIKYTREG